MCFTGKDLTGRSFKQVERTGFIQELQHASQDADNELKPDRMRTLLLQTCAVRGAGWRQHLHQCHYFRSTVPAMLTVANAVI